MRPDLPDPRSMAEIADALHDAAAGIQHGKCKESLPRLQEIVKKDPHNFPALTLAGSCLEEAGRWDSALALFQRASKENELSAVPVANIAGCLKQLGRRAEAEKEYRRALALDPSLGEAASNLAELLGERGERAEAMRVLDASIAAGSAYRLGRNRESVQHYEQLLRLQPGRGDLWKTAGALYFYELGDKADAERCFRRALVEILSPS